MRAKELENRVELGYKGRKVSSDESGFMVCGTGMPNDKGGVTYAGKHQGKD